MTDKCEVCGRPADVKGYHVLHHDIKDPHDRQQQALGAISDEAAYVAFEVTSSCLAEATEEEDIDYRRPSSLVEAMEELHQGIRDEWLVMADVVDIIKCAAAGDLTVEVQLWRLWANGSH